MEVTLLIFQMRFFVSLLATAIRSSVFCDVHMACVIVLRVKGAGCGFKFDVCVGAFIYLQLKTNVCDYLSYVGVR